MFSCQPECFVYTGAAGTRDWTGRSMGPIQRERLFSKKKCYDVGKKVNWLFICMLYRNTHHKTAMGKVIVNDKPEL